MTKQSTLIILIGLSLLSGTAFAAKAETIRPLLQKSQVAQCHDVENFAQHIASDSSTPRNIILMVGDGMGPEQIACGVTANKGKLHMQRLPILGMTQTTSASALITDSAASGTAFACGVKTYNGALGITEDGKPVTSTAALAKAQGMLTGLVVTKAITDATPAAFYAHTAKRTNTKEIAADLAQAKMDVIIGGGKDHFTAEQLAQLEKDSDILDLYDPQTPPTAVERKNALVKGTKAALASLEKLDKEQGGKGFFLMIEGSQIDSWCHANHLYNTLEETLDFDRSVGVVLKWMEKNPDTLLVVIADHCTGGLSIQGGNMAEGKVEATYSTGGHNGIFTLLMAGGAGSTVFTGFMDNTDIHKKMRHYLELKAKK